MQHAEVTDHPVVRAGLLACADTLRSEAGALERSEEIRLHAGNPPSRRIRIGITE
jgi:hypothetical protein